MGLAVLWLAPSSAEALTFHLDSLGGLKLYQGEVLGRENTPAGNREAPGQVKKSQRIIVRDYGSSGRKQVRIQPGVQSNIEAQVRTQNYGEDGQIQLMEQTQTYESDQVRLMLDEQSEDEELEDELEAGEEELDEEAEEEEEDSETEELIIERSEDNQISLQSGKVKARTGAQFILDQDTGLVTIVTPSGNTHQLKHFPESAITVMLEKGKMTLAETGETEETTEDGLEEPADSIDEETDGDTDSELADLIDEDTDTTETDQELAEGSLDEVTEEEEITTAAAQDYDLELTENEDGEVVYKFTGEVDKKLLGLIPWRLTQEVEMVDSTGEVRVKQPNSVFNRMLDALSTS